MRELFDLMRRGKRDTDATERREARQTAPQREQTQAEMRADFASDLAILKARAGMLGLSLTMHRMDFPLRMVGSKFPATRKRAGDMRQRRRGGRGGGATIRWRRRER